MNRVTLMTIRKMFILMGVVIVPVLAQEFQISRRTVDGGGAMNSTDGNFELSGTIGQPDAGSMSGGNFILMGGFWFESAQGDCNTDGEVNLADYDDLASCLAGPDSNLNSTACQCYDADSDSDVDLRDMARFMGGFLGM